MIYKSITDINNIQKEFEINDRFMMIPRKSLYYRKKNINSDKHLQLFYVL